jgi:hypothetical protein
MSDECAVGPDGKLRDAKDIVFYHDADDLIPIGAPSSSASAPTSIKDFFPRRSGRQTVPSARATDPNNAENGKRKAAAVLQNPRASARARPAQDDSDDADPGEATDLEDDVGMADVTAPNRSQDGEDF